MKRRISTLLLLALGMVFSSGCMTYRLYDGNKRPQGELGTIKLGVILAVDDGNLQYLTGHNLLVLPGRHSLGLTTKRGKASAVACTFDVVVEAGHVYAGVVEHDKSGSGKPPVIYVMDKTADRVVARHPPLPVARATKKKSTPAVPAKSAQADRKADLQEPAKVAKSSGATPPPPWKNQPLAPETIAKLRQLRQLKNQGIITNEEYLRKGYALVGTR